MRSPIALVLVLAGSVAGCVTPGATRPAPPREVAAAAPAVERLQSGDFEAAGRAADDVLAAQPKNARAAAVSAIVRYKGALHQLWIDLVTVVEGAQRGGFNHKYMRESLEETGRALGRVDALLAHAAADPGFALDLCVACWRVDWNHDGRFTSRDERLFQIEQDADGNRLADEDPRRRPTLRFDVGDVHWARAMVTFQRALFELLLAYRWEEVDKLLDWKRFVAEGSLRIRLESRARVAHARALLVEALDHADRARLAILAETDDEREWVPSPRQKDHPLPLPVDDALFATWAGVTEDLRRLVRGDEALAIDDLAALGRPKWSAPPGGYLDLGRLLADPRDLTFDLHSLEHFGDQPRAALASLFGIGYVPSQKRSALPARLARMKSELDRGEETFERKLRYLFWLN